MPSFSNQIILLWSVRKPRGHHITYLDAPVSIFNKQESLESIGTDSSHCVSPEANCLNEDPVPTEGLSAPKPPRQKKTCIHSPKPTYYLISITKSQISTINISRHVRICMNLAAKRKPPPQKSISSMMGTVNKKTPNFCRGPGGLSKYTYKPDEPHSYYRS